MENNNFDGFNGIQTALPNSTAVLVLGIISIPTCCCYGIVGIISAVVALILAKNAENLYVGNPENYLVSSYKNLKAGKTCAIIGLILSVLYLIFVIFAIAMFGIKALSDPQALQELLQQYQ